MGLLKVLFFTLTPAGFLLYPTFKLGKELPKAARLMGNYIGLSYVYFKVVLKNLRPTHDLGVEIVDIVRKTAQQTRALQRQLQQAARDLNDTAKAAAKIYDTDQTIQKQKQKQQLFETIRSVRSGNILIKELMQERKRITQQRISKVKSNKFFNQT